MIAPRPERSRNHHVPEASLLIFRSQMQRERERERPKAETWRMKERAVHVLDSQGVYVHAPHR